MIDDYVKLMDLVRSRTPFAFAAMNDGECRAMFNCAFSHKRDGQPHISRSKQLVSCELKVALNASMQHRQLNYWIGLTCPQCYSSFRSRQDKMVTGYSHTTYAVVFTRGNHARFDLEFPAAVSGRDVVWVGGEDQTVRRLPFSVCRQIRVPMMDAFEWWEATGADSFVADMPRNAVVLLSCGALGRIIPYRWFRHRSDLTIIGLGSHYDPLTLNIRTAKIHRGKARRCRVCFPRC